MHYGLVESTLHCFEKSFLLVFCHWPRPQNQKYWGVTSQKHQTPLTLSQQPTPRPEFVGIHFFDVIKRREYVYHQRDRLLPLWGSQCGTSRGQMPPAVEATSTSSRDSS